MPRRSLLTGLCLLVIGIAALQPATSSSTRRTHAAAARIPSTTAAQPTTRAPKRRGLDARTTAVTFAKAYADYLANRLPGMRLPTLSRAAAAMVRQSGPLPARLHIRRVQLISVDGAATSWTAQFAVIDSRGRFVLSAGLLLAPSGAGWQLAELVAPDPDFLIASPSSAARPVGPDAARDTAMTFTSALLAFTYGHAGIGQLRGVTSGLRAELAADAPRVPPTIRARRPAGREPRALTPWQRVAGERERHRRTKHLPGDQHPRSGPRQLARGGAALRRMSATDSTRPADPGPEAVSVTPRPKTERAGSWIAARNSPDAGYPHRCAPTAVLPTKPGQALP